MNLSKNQQTVAVIIVGAMAVIGALGIVTVLSSPGPASKVSGPSTGPSSNVSVGTWPSAVLFDASNQLIYVTVENSNGVAVVNASGLSLMTTIPFNGARGLALDPTNGHLIVSDGYGDDFMVIDTANNSEGTTHVLSGYTDLVGAQFDATTDQLFFLANNNDDILSVSPANYTLTQPIQVQPNTGGGDGPIAAVDPQTHVMYYAARGSYEIDLIGELNGSVFGQFPAEYLAAGGILEGPVNTFYDPYNNLLYVALGGWLYSDPGNQVIVLNPTTGVQVANATVGVWPSSFAYDAARHLLYVSCESSGTISVIDDRTNQVVDTLSLGASSMPGPIAIDPANGDLFVGEDGTGLLVEIPPA